MPTVPDAAPAGAAAPAADRPVPSTEGPGERSRLRPSPPLEAHAPLLLGLDAGAAEQAQGPTEDDDESLVGRLWGCTCGWRGTVRDVASRHFHPRVGDGGGLRRKRLARADRDARGELEAHLAATVGAPPTPAAAGPVASGPVALPAAADGDPGVAVPSRPLRRRLTLPRPDPVDDDAPSPREAGNTFTTVPAVGPARPADSGPAGMSPEESTANLASSNEHHQVRPEVRGAGTERAPTPSEHPSAAPENALAAAADRAREARVEFEAAEAVLDTAVAAARESGASWRTIARLTGTPHRQAAARWGGAVGGASL